jgi:hypothetical protein
MSLIGFSTGALALGDFAGALKVLRRTSMNAVELSALRLSELPGLVNAISELDLRQFSYISFHAPSRFDKDEEDFVIELLHRVPENWPIILHPDTIHAPEKWQEFGSQLAIENMDRRKPLGRSAEELAHCFERLPKAKLCLDLAHVHQFDRTMTEAYRMLKMFRERVCQLHISELDSSGHHFPLSFGSMRAFMEVNSMIPVDSAAILESLNPFKGEEESAQVNWIELEGMRAHQALGLGAHGDTSIPLTNSRRLRARTVPA